MELNEALILLLTHGIPILFFTYMATDVWLRNKKKTEHILLSLIAICYLLLFAEEYIRNQVSIAYSPILSSLWLSSAGFIIIGLCFHFIIKFTGLYTQWPRFIYPYIFYLPLIFVVLNMITGAKLISAQEFVQVGMWKLPVYNSGYYIAMTVSIATDVMYLVPLLIARAKSTDRDQRSIYNHLMFGIMIAVIWHVVFGYMNYGDKLPPYPYLYSGIVWCYFLRRTMRQHDFLNLFDKRYEKLFNLNPAAILLVDLNGSIKDANPGAKKLLASLNLSSGQLFDLFDDSIKKNIHAEQEIQAYATEITHHGVRMILLVDTGNVRVDHEPHVLLILRDITIQKQYQEEITFLAYHDPLTRLPNRRLFYDMLEGVLLEAGETEESLALLFIDIDHIKLINDAHGHIAGDETLQHIAELIVETVGNRGMAARMSGDEFVLYIRHSPSEQEIGNLVEHLQRNFSMHVSKYSGLPIDLSIGVSQYPGEGEDVQALINLADQAMYEIKRKRKKAPDS